MSDEAALLRTATTNPGDALARLVLADYYDERGDPRGAYLRAAVAVAQLPPDHPLRPAAEEAWGRARVGLGAGWLARLEPTGVLPGASCGCYRGAHLRPRKLVLHDRSQDTECDGWKRLLDLIEDAAADRR